MLSHLCALSFGQILSLVYSLLCFSASVLSSCSLVRSSYLHFAFHPFLPSSSLLLYLLCRLHSSPSVIVKLKLRSVLCRLLLSFFLCRGKKLHSSMPSISTVDCCRLPALATSLASFAAALPVRAFLLASPRSPRQTDIQISRNNRIPHLVVCVFLQRNCGNPPLCSNFTLSFFSFSQSTNYTGAGCPYSHWIRPFPSRALHSQSKTTNLWPWLWQK